jgi:hypothetical protein
MNSGRSTVEPTSSPIARPTCKPGRARNGDNQGQTTRLSGPGHHHRRRLTSTRLEAGSAPASRGLLQEPRAVDFRAGEIFHTTGPLEFHHRSFDAERKSRGSRSGGRIPVRGKQIVNIGGDF